MMNIDQLYQKAMISQIDLRFGQLMARYATTAQDIVTLAAALASWTTANGNVCLDLNQEIIFTENEEGHAGPEELRIDPNGWEAALQGSRVVGQPGEYKPMILDGGRLYLQRQWQYEQDVAMGIQQRCHSIFDHNDSKHLTQQILQLFPEGDDLQRQAVLSGLTQGFTVISGGPGTGKTYTIAKLILLMQQLNLGAELRIKLAAPTGKAAIRLQQAIEKVMAGMGKGRDTLKAIGGGIQTLHRLLGAMSGQSTFRYNSKNKLQTDVVIIDEASMIDLSMMAALIAAMPATARLILIGDKNQLASVEAGAVLGDICSGADIQKFNDRPLFSDLDLQGTLPPRIVVLQHSYRFATQGSIDAFAVAVNAGEAETAKALMNKRDCVDVVFKNILDIQGVESALNELITDIIAPNFKTVDPIEALDRMTRLMILSPIRNGPFGVMGINHFIEQVLIKQGKISAMQSVGDGWYPGRPVMITRNDYYHNLFNGDVGIALEKGKGADSDLSVFFQDGAGGCKQLPWRQLPSHETAFAMTVHKSQGSEFDRVILVLPNWESPVVTRELVYTAITRARHSVEIWGTERCLEQAVIRQTKRSSGLKQLLWPIAL